jgi:hypothetical protein
MCIEVLGLLRIKTSEQLGVIPSGPKAECKMVADSNQVAERKQSVAGR